MPMPTYSNIVSGATGQYSFGQPDHLRGGVKPVVQVLNTPAQYYAETIADLADGANLAIDFGQNWYLGVADTAAFIDYARDVMNRALASA